MPHVASAENLLAPAPYITALPLDEGRGCVGRWLRDPEQRHTDATHGCDTKTMVAGVGVNQVCVLFKNPWCRNVNRKIFLLVFTRSVPLPHYSGVACRSCWHFFTLAYSTVVPISKILPAGMHLVRTCDYNGLFGIIFYPIFVPSTVSLRPPTRGSVCLASLDRFAVVLICSPDKALEPELLTMKS